MRRRILLPIIAAVCYVTSFFLPALWLTGQANTAGQETNMLGMMAFINGFFALFNLQTAWLANPLAALAVILLLCGRWIGALIVSLAAVVIAQHTWVVVDTIISGDEGGVTKFLVTGLAPGFYVWCFSFVLLALAALTARGTGDAKPPPLPVNDPVK